MRVYVCVYKGLPNIYTTHKGRALIKKDKLHLQVNHCKSMQFQTKYAFCIRYIAVITIGLSYTDLSKRNKVLLICSKKRMITILNQMDAQQYPNRMTNSATTVLLKPNEQSKAEY